MGIASGSPECAHKRAAASSVYPGMPWNRCQFHLESRRRGTQAYVPNESMKESFVDEILSIFDPNQWSSKVSACLSGRQ